ncbi:hypothetical protein CHARACLAT_005141, partial [Characodon lateralis]|nr:hypothetical protein [Characodon lateralis]
MSSFFIVENLKKLKFTLINNILFCFLNADTVPGGMSLLTHVMRVAHCYLFSPLGLQGVEKKCSQTQAMPRHQSPGRVYLSRTSASFTQAQ